jgi:D-3-phosphoglycerate dehydrogenase
MTLKDEVRPFVVLAEKLGSCAAQLAGGKLVRLTISAAGEQAIASLDLLKAGVLKGVLSQLQPDPVNYISAPFLASEMGLSVHEVREGEPDIFVNVLRVRYETDRGTRELVGTVIGRSTPRLVGMDAFRFEVKPEGDLLIYNNMDRPGMLARVGEVLARHKVNIAGVSLGRAQVGGNALTIMNIDSSIPSEGLTELGHLEGVSNLRLIHLG